MMTTTRTTTIRNTHCLVNSLVSQLTKNKKPVLTVHLHVESLQHDQLLSHLFAVHHRHQPLQLQAQPPANHSKMRCYYAAVLAGLSMGLAHGHNSKTKRWGRTKIGVDVPEGMLTGVPTFSSSNVRIAQLYVDGHTICRHWANVFF